MLISKFPNANFDEELEICSDKLGISFPKELVSFLGKYNGGETPATKFSIHGISSDVRAFYGLGNVTYSYSRVKMVDAGTRRYLPVAFDSFGNEVVMDVESGEIFFYDHETNAINQLTYSLKEFIYACTSEHINPSSCKTVEEREEHLIKHGRGSIITDELRKMWETEIKKFNSINQEEVKL